MTGIYGVMAYHVNQRRRETAIRRALGAQLASVVGGVVLTGLTLVGTGISSAASALADVAQPCGSALSVDPRDPAALITVAALLATAALVACAVPAARAARINPASVLRDE